jgi:hypothetical protein
MTNKHPITPPPNLTDKWNNLSLSTEKIFVIAAQWGADQELEACCEEMKSLPKPFGIPCGKIAANALRAARRPKPPSLKEQALESVKRFKLGQDLMGDLDTIRCALEQLPE